MMKSPRLDDFLCIVGIKEIMIGSYLYVRIRGNHLSLALSTLGLPKSLV